jgi:hypothetical protein
MAVRTELRVLTAEQVSSTDGIESSCSPISSLATRSGPSGEPALSDHPIVADPIARRLAPKPAEAIAVPASAKRDLTPGYRRVAPVSHVTHRAATSASWPIRK